VEQEFTEEVVETKLEALEAEEELAPSPEPAGASE